MPSLNAWQSGRRKTRIKIISFLIFICFVFPGTSFVFDCRVYADNVEAAAVQASLKANGAVIKIPEKRGIITSSFKSASQYTVIYIHDLHCNYEVQDNIAAIIRLLAERNQLRLIGVEGDSEKVDVSLLSTFPIKKVKIDTGRHFMRQGLITGAEYQAATGDKPLALEGIEDKALYQANKKSLLAFLNEESQGYCEDIRDALVRLKKPVYNIGLAKLDHKREEYDYENITLENYCDFLLGEARKQGIETTSYKALARYAMNQQLPLIATLSYEHLLEDAEILDRALRRKLYTSSDQRQLDHYLYLLKVMESLVNISATEKDLRYFRSNRKEFSAAAMLRFLEEVCYRYVMEPDIDSGILRLDGFLAQAADFYKVADRRSSAFVRNLLSHMQSRQQKLAVLITGGFHASHVEQALRENQVSYLAIKPRITRTDVPNPYFSLIRDKDTPLDQLLARKEKLFALSTRFREVKSQKLLVLAKEVILRLHIRLAEKLKGPAAQARAEEVNKKHEAVLAERGVLVGDLPEIIKNTRLEFQGKHSDPGKKIFTFQIKGRDFYIVLRPDGVMTNYPEIMMMPEVRLRENNFVMQFISRGKMEQHSARILGREKKSQTPAIVASLTNLPMNIRQRVAAWFGAGRGEKEAVIDPRIEQDDIISKALAWSARYGYGQTRMVGDSSFEMVLRYVFDLAEKKAEVGQTGMKKFIDNKHSRLALLGIAFKIGKLPIGGMPEDMMLALARDYLSAEDMAKQIMDGVSLGELKPGQSQLAQLVASINNKETIFRLGGRDANNPARLMPVYYSALQTAAIKKLVRESNIILEVSGPQFNPWLGFYPKSKQVIEAYEELVEFARGLGPSKRIRITTPLKDTRFVNLIDRIMENAVVEGVGTGRAIRQEPIIIAAKDITGILETIYDWQRLGIEPQPASPESRFIKVLFNRVESWKAMRFLSRPGGYLGAGISSSLWVGVVSLLGGIISAEAAVRTGIAVTATLMPNKYFAYKINTGPRLASPWVSSVMKSAWMEKNLQSTSKWPRTQAVVILGLLRVMKQVMAIDPGAVEDVLKILEAMPGEKRKIQIAIRGEIKSMNIPAMIFKQPSLFRRIQSLPITDENGQPLKIERKRRNLTVQSAA